MYPVRTIATTISLAALLLLLAVLGIRSMRSEVDRVAADAEAGGAGPSSPGLPVNELMAVQERQSVSNAAVPTGALLFVEDSHGVPVVAAQLYLAVGDVFAATSLGKTDENGQCPWSFPLGQEHGVLVTAAGFESKIEQLPREFEAHRIVLGLGAAIRGRVLDAAGAAVSEHIAVFGWPTSENDDGRAAAARAIAGDRSQALALTDFNGQFVLEGLKPQAEYYLVAAGQGVMTRELTTAIAADNANCELRTAWIHGTRLVVKAQSGAQVPAFAADVRGLDWRSRTDDPDAKACVPLASCLELMGLSAMGGDGSARLCLYSTTQEVASVGPNRVTLELPGYLPAEAAFHSIALSSGVNDVELWLTPTAPGFGELEVSFTAVAGISPPTYIPEGSIVLAAAGKRAQHFGIAAGENVPKFFRHLPAGEYLIHFQSETSFARAPEYGPIPVEIGIDTKATIAIQMPALGSISIQVQTRDAREFTGPIAFNLGIGQPRVLSAPESIHGTVLDPGSVSYGPTTTHRFGAAPYIIDGLAAGTYGVVSVESPGVGSPSVEWPSGIPLARTMPAVVTVPRGGVVSCSFVLER